MASGAGTAFIQNTTSLFLPGHTLAWGAPYVSPRSESFLMGGKGDWAKGGSISKRPSSGLSVSSPRQAVREPAGWQVGHSPSVPKLRSEGGWTGCAVRMRGDSAIARARY